MKELTDLFRTGKNCKMNQHFGLFLKPSVETISVFQILQTFSKKSLRAISNEAIPQYNRSNRRETKLKCQLKKVIPREKVKLCVMIMKRILQFAVVVSKFRF